MLKLSVTLLLALGLFLAPLGAGAADVKIAVVDGMDIMSKSAEGKRIQESLKRKFEELGKPVASKRQDIARQMQEFEKQASVMKEDARKRKAEELEKKMAELDKQGTDAEKQMAQYQEKELAPLFQKLEQAVKAVATEKKMDMVMDKRNSGLLYLNPSMDITDTVRAKFGK
jgi:outer membrane protein